MRWILSLLLLAIICGTSYGQYLDPTTKATLDYYYDQQTISIDGSRIVDGTVTTNKFLPSILGLWMYVDGRNAMEATLDLGSNLISNVTDPVDPQDAATRNYIDEREVYAGGWCTNGTLTLTNVNVYYAWTNWVMGLISDHGHIGWTNNGIQVLDEAGAGVYRIDGNISVAQDKINEELEAEVFSGSNGIAVSGQEKLSGHSYFITANKPFSIPVGGLLRLGTNAYVELRFRNKAGNGRIISAVDGIINFRMQRIGD